MKYLIIGGVAGGATTAARLRRMDETSEIILFERGAYISYANCGLPYYIGGTISDRDQLFVQTPESFGTRFNLDVRVQSEVTEIHREAKKVTVNNLNSGETYEESYDKLILSPGAEPIRPPYPAFNKKASSPYVTFRIPIGSNRILTKKSPNTLSSLVPDSLVLKWPKTYTDPA